MGNGNRSNKELLPSCGRLILKFIPIILLINAAQSQTRYTCPAGTNSVPTRPPRVAVGNYESIIVHVDTSKRDVFIYWQTIEEIEMCDYSFEYRAFYVTKNKNNKIIDMIPSNGTLNNNRARFIGLSTDVGYDFRVYSANKEGLSANYASVYVSSISNQLKKPLSLSWKEHTVGSSIKYQLSWTTDENLKFSVSNQLDYYTLYWCKVEQDYLYQCMDQLNWLHVPGSENSYDLTIPTPGSSNSKYVFAISANRLRNSYNSNNTVSSGMMWETCSTLRSNSTFTVKNFWIMDVKPTHIGLRWKIDCTENFDVINDYEIIYCVVGRGDYCSSIPTTKVFVNKYSSHDRVALFYIMQLRPSTKYMIRMQISSASVKANSTNLYVTTPAYNY